VIGVFSLIGKSNLSAIFFKLFSISILSAVNTNTGSASNNFFALSKAFDFTTAKDASTPVLIFELLESILYC